MESNNSKKGFGKILSIFKSSKKAKNEQDVLFDSDHQIDPSIETDDLDKYVVDDKEVDMSLFFQQANERLSEIDDENIDKSSFDQDYAAFLENVRHSDSTVSHKKTIVKPVEIATHDIHKVFEEVETVEVVDKPEVSAKKVNILETIEEYIDPTPADDEYGTVSNLIPYEEVITPVKKKLFRPDGSEMADHRFGKYLLDKGLITVIELDAASREQSVTGERLGQILVSNSMLSDKDRVEAILAVSSERIAQENVSRSKIPINLLEDFQIMISAQTDEMLYVSTPMNQNHVSDVVREYYGPVDIEFVSFDPTRFDAFLTQIRKTDKLESVSQDKSDHLNRILYKALSEGASDIHVMPRKKSYSIMFRILGVRRIIHEGKIDEYNTMLAQIKDKASMDLAEKRKPQDGGFNIDYGGKGIDFRVATNPTATGEVIVMRVLDPDRVQPSLSKLGITDVKKWRKGFNQQHGLCLICGPTGSGKTTTLNSSMREINRFEKAIYTIEDPVEYRIPYITQMSVNLAVGVTFASAIRAFMRSDPDVIVLGEVRDEETARNMIKAADTGHLVLATLHTGSIVGAVSRLRDLGVPPRELRYLLRSVMVQTLVRTLCPVCDGVGHDETGTVCYRCNGTKYTGRTVVSECEFFEDPAAVDKIINSTEHDVQRTWPTMVEDAYKKMKEGRTDADELKRVFGAAAEPYITGEKQVMELPES